MTELWNHQKIAIERAKNLSSYALHFEAGTGKTLTAIQIMRERFNRNKRILRTLIFCPPIVIGNWREEWFKYTKIDRKDVIPLIGSGAQRLKTFRQQAFNEKGERRGKVFITNYESLVLGDSNRDKGKKRIKGELFEAFKAWCPEQTIHDESHRAKNPSSVMAQSLDDLVNKFSKPSLRLNLSGTSILNNPMDLFQQFKILMGGFPTLESIVTGKHIVNFYQFRNIYFEDKNARWKGEDGYYPKWLPKPSTLDLFGKLLESVSMSVDKKDCLDLPDEVDVTIPVPLNKEQRTDYDKFERDMVLNIEGKNYTADIAMVRALRLMQIASGFISGLDFPDAAEAQPIKYEYKNTEREKALEELLDELCVGKGKKVLVWAVWKHNYEVIKAVCDKLGIRYVECHGLVSAKGKEGARKSFIEDSDIKVWIGHPYSGGIGVNLIVAPYTIWYSRNFSLEQYEQAKARNYRGGQTEKVTHYHLVAVDTIEPEVIESLQNKKSISDLILSKTNIYKK